MSSRDNAAVMPSMALATQAAEPTREGWTAWLADLAALPGVVEVVFAGTLLLLGYCLWRSWRRLVDAVQSRTAIEDYLLGVEQALAQDLEGARERLQRVLAQDPENHYARLMLGQVLTGLGEPARAHQHHLLLQQAFAVHSAANDLQTARALLGTGRPREAAAAAEQALRADPRLLAAAELAFRAQLQAGDAAAAALLGQRWLDQAPSEQKAQVRAELAAAECLAGTLALQRGESAAAAAALQRARTLAAEAPAVTLLTARLAAQREGPAQAARRLLAEPTRPGSRPSLPGPVGAAWLPALVPLLPAGPFLCPSCGLRRAQAAAQCPHCLAAREADLGEPRMMLPLAEPQHHLDAIELNPAHVQRVVAAAVAGGEDLPLQEDVLRLGERAVPELLRVAAGRGERADAAIRLLQRLGPSMTNALFQAADAIEDERWLPFGQAPVTQALGRVLQGFDRSALPQVQGLFAAARPGTRKVLIDFFLGLADLAQFQLVLAHFSPLEILDRFHKVEAEVLRRFLQQVVPGSFVADVLLREPSFRREDLLLAAIPGARHPELLERILVDRGPQHTVVEALLAAVADERLGATACRVLGAFGAAAQQHVLAAFVDRERPATVRERLAEVLIAHGVHAVDQICRSFGPEPAELDEDLRGVLVRLGEPAVAALREAYARPSTLETLTIGLLSNASNRRSQILRALAQIGSPAAQTALRALAGKESDPDLQLRIKQALHAVESRSQPGRTHR